MARVRPIHAPPVGRSCTIPAAHVGGRARAHGHQVRCGHQCHQCEEGGREYSTPLWPLLMLVLIRWRCGRRSLAPLRPPRCSPMPRWRSCRRSCMSWARSCQWHPSTQAVRAGGGLGCEGSELRAREGRGIQLPPYIGPNTQVRSVESKEGGRRQAGARSRGPRRRSYSGSSRCLPRQQRRREARRRLGVMGRGAIRRRRGRKGGTFCRS